MVWHRPKGARVHKSSVSPVSHPGTPTPFGRRSPNRPRLLDDPRLVLFPSLSGWVMAQSCPVDGRGFAGGRSFVGCLLDLFFPKSCMFSKESIIQQVCATHGKSIFCCQRGCAKSKHPHPHGIWTVPSLRLDSAAILSFRAFVRRAADGRVADGDARLSIASWPSKQLLVIACQGAEPRSMPGPAHPGPPHPSSRPPGGEEGGDGQKRHGIGSCSSHRPIRCQYQGPAVVILSLPPRGDALSKFPSPSFVHCLLSQFISRLRHHSVPCLSFPSICPKFPTIQSASPALCAEIDPSLPYLKSVLHNRRLDGLKMARKSGDQEKGPFPPFPWNTCIRPIRTAPASEPPSRV
jgi:hypothetical protein